MKKIAFLSGAICGVCLSSAFVDPCTAGPIDPGRAIFAACRAGRKYPSIEREAAMSMSTRRRALCSQPLAMERLTEATKAVWSWRANGR
jgi:hypothetical protein